MCNPDVCGQRVHQHDQQPKSAPQHQTAEPSFIDDVQTRHHGRFVPRRTAFQKLRRLFRTVGGEPFPILMLHVGGVAKPGFECLKTAVGQPIELGVRWIIVDLNSRAMILRQQLVIGVHRAGMRPHGQPGGPSQIGPVPPAVVDVIRSNPGLPPEGEDGDIRPVSSRQRPQLFQQRFPRRLPHRPPPQHPGPSVRGITSLPPIHRGGCARWGEFPCGRMFEKGADPV